MGGGGGDCLEEVMELESNPRRSEKGSSSDQKSCGVSFRSRFTPMKSEMIAPPHIFHSFVVVIVTHYESRDKQTREKKKKEINVRKLGEREVAVYLDLYRPHLL